jgi:hypothetical protein
MLLKTNIFSSPFGSIFFSDKMLIQINVTYKSSRCKQFFVLRLHYIGNNILEVQPHIVLEAILLVNRSTIFLVGSKVKLP